MRLFFSIAIPDALREQLVRQRDAIKRTCFTAEQSQRMRWTDPDQYHVTQYFVGDVHETRLDDLKRVARNVVEATKAFALTAEQLEFKPRRNPRLLWLRFRPNETFETLMQQLHNALVTEQLSNNELAEEPIPHLTLIRLKQTKPLDTPLPEIQPYTFSVTQIDLMQSFTKPTGAEYKTLERFDLAV